MKEGQALQGSPYVEQIEKYASSLKQLSHTFLELEAHKEEFSGADIDGMFDRVKERVCKKCEKNAWCWGENFVHTYQMGYDVLSAVDHYGNELNVETKRKLMQRCEKAPRFLREMLEGFRDARQTIIWTNRLARSREGCAFQMDLFADIMKQTVRELEKSIFTDERMEKRIAGALRKCGMRVLYTYLFLNGEGKFEVHVTVRSTGKEKGTAKEVVQAVSEALNIIANVLGKPLGKIFSVSAAGAFSVIAGFLCGYPMGAKVTADLVCTKKIERSEAAYLLSFCNNTSPVFIVNFIIHKILRDRTLLVPTLIILIAVPIFLSFFFRRFYFKHSESYGESLRQTECKNNPFSFRTFDR